MKNLNSSNVLRKNNNLERQNEIRDNLDSIIYPDYF